MVVAGEQPGAADFPRQRASWSPPVIMDTVLHDIAATDARTLSHAASSKWLDDIHTEIRDVKVSLAPPPACFIN